MSDEKKEEGEEGGLEALLPKRRPSSTSGNDNESEDSRELFLIRLRYREGRLVELGSNRPLVLNEPETVWVVFAGRVDVFLVPLCDGEIAGTRRFLFQAEAGQALFGFASELAPDVQILAVGHADAQAIRIPRERLQKLLANRAFAQEGIALMEGWIERLGAAIGREMPPRDCKTQGLGSFTAQPNSAFRPERGVAWLKGDALNLLGVERMDAFGAGAIPLSSRLWVSAHEESAASLKDTAQTLNAGEAWAGLERLHAFAQHLFARQMSEDAARSEANFQERDSAESLQRLQSFYRLAAVLNPEKGLSAEREEGEPLLSLVCRLTAHSQGIALPPLKRPFRETQSLEQVREMARYGRIRTRAVSLKGDWYRQDCGSLIAFLEEEGETRPVALLRHARNYEVLDPFANRRVKLTPALAQRLQPLGHCFYRPFPNRPIALKELLGFGLRDCKKDLLATASAGVFAGALALLTPVWMGKLIGEAIPNGARSHLGVIMGGLLAAGIAVTLFQLLRGLAMLRLETHLATSVQSAVIDRILGLPASFFRQYSSGDLSARTLTMRHVRQLLSGSVLSSLFGSVFALFSFGVLFHYDPSMAWWATGLSLFALAVTFGDSAIQLRFRRQLAAQQGELSGLTIQLLSGIAKIRMTGAETRAFGLWTRSFARQRETLLQVRNTSLALNIFHTGWSPCVTLIFFALMASKQTRLPTSDFIAFLTAYGQFQVAMLSLAGAIDIIMQAIPLVERIRPILETPPEVPEGSADPGELHGSVHVEGVSFRYAADAPYALQEVTLHANPGEFIAIAGASGAGKSTLFRILAGLESPESGSVFYDDKDLGNLDVQAVRRRMGIVLQEGKLMAGNIFQNIVGASALTLDDAWEAARMAGIEAEIRSLPMEMFTLVNEGGSTFSAGQRQRLLIARAIAHRPQIILFDEATSALDNRAQALVTQSLERLHATRIVIAHRLSTIEKADRIYVMKEGRIAETGTYEELMKQSGIFAELAKRQIA